MIDMNSRLKAHSHGFGHEGSHVGSPWNFKSVYVRVQHGKGAGGGGGGGEEQWERVESPLAACKFFRISCVIQNNMLQITPISVCSMAYTD